jgi:PAS domain S-box-containing protein
MRRGGPPPEHAQTLPPATAGVTREWVMLSPASTPPPDDALVHDTRRAQVQGHLAGLALASLASALTGLLGLWLLAALVPAPRLQGWALVLMAVLALRWWLLRPAAAAQQSTAVLQVRLRATVLLHGLVWAALAWLVPGPPGPELLLPLTALLGGVSAAGLTLALHDLVAAALYVAPMLVSLLVQLARSTQPLPQVVVVVLWLLGLVALAMVGGARIAQRWRLELMRSRQADAQLRRVFDHVGEGLGLFDAQWRLQAWNQRLFELLGLDLALARRGLTLHEALLALARSGAYGDGDPQAQADRRLAAMTRPGPGHWQRTRADGRVIELRRSLLPDGGMTVVCVDITERRASELALSTNRRMLQVLLEGTEEGFWFIDNELRTTDANRAMCRMLGVERDALLGRSIFEFVDEANKAVFLRQVELRAQGQASSYEITLRRVDGTPVHCHNSATPIVDETGDKVGAVGLFSDISANKRAAAELQRTSELLAAKTRVLESTFDSLAQGVMSFGPDGRLEAWNRRAAELLQLPEDLLRQHLRLRDLTQWQMAQGHLQSLSSTAGPAAHEATLRFLSGDDAALWETPRYQRQRPDGVVIEVQAFRAADGAHVRTFTDVTEAMRTQHALRESEMRFRTMADAAPALIWLSDATGRVTWLNQTWLRTAGRTLLEALAEPWGQRVHPDDYPRTRLIYRDAFVRRVPYTLECRVLRADGQDMWVADAGIPRFGADGRFDGFVSYGWDITTRKAAESALIAARDEAERANRAKSDFLSRMSHELRTPLNAVMGFAQLIEHDSAEPPTALQRERVRQIQHGGAHLLQLINEVLDLSRIESGTLSLHSDAVDVDALVGDCRRLVVPMAQQQQVQLRVEPPALGWGRVHTDATRLRQVLLNLLSNAIKYNHPQGQVRLQGSADEHRVRVEVIDTGPGLSQQQQQRLFQAFERLGADRGGVEGTGIGLALSQSLVALMGGRIGVHSQPGQGSTFWMELPRGQAPALAAAPPPQATLQRPAPPPWTGVPRQVLYIEDNPVNQIIVESMLGHLPGVEVRLADDPRQGLQQARERVPDLVLLDIQLPAMSGFEVLQALRADPATRAVPVLALSANAMPEDVARARAVGFDDYLTKPVTLEALLAAVATRLPGGND